MLVKIACGVVGCGTRDAHVRPSTLRSLTPCRLATDDFSGAFQESGLPTALLAAGGETKLRQHDSTPLEETYEELATKLRQHDSAGANKKCLHRGLSAEQFMSAGSYLIEL